MGHARRSPIGHILEFPLRGSIREAFELDQGFNYQVVEKG
jgi:hypothetical protein